MSNQIKIKNLSLTKSDQEVLKDISSSLTLGKSYLLFGKNGAGKSSLIRCLAGHETHFKGEISFNGQQLNKVRTAYLPEDLNVPDSIAVKRYSNSLRYFFESEHSFDPIKFKNLSNKFRLEELMELKFGQLSKGMKKLFFLVLVLCIDTSIKLFDEPFEGLDILNKDELITAFLEETSSGRLVIVSTHEIEMLSNRFEKLLILKNGILTTMSMGTITMENLKRSI